MCFMHANVSENNRHRFVIPVRSDLIPFAAWPNDDLKLLLRPDLKGPISHSATICFVEELCGLEGWNMRLVLQSLRPDLIDDFAVGRPESFN
jgi:hypothetical protein